jgi:hypothetical protein
VQPFFEWFTKTVDPSDPWLILGKGPSFGLRTSFDLSRFHLLSLNHVVREQPVRLAHVIDLDVIQACALAIEKNAQTLVMPWYPHDRNLAGHRTLEEIADELPVLGRLRDEGRLLWYDLSTSPIRHGPGPVIQATYFSAEAALNLLALAGVRRVRSLGLDGGSAYGGAFEDLRNSTLLANGRANFDQQFKGFARTILRTGVDFSPLDVPAPARAYVAYEPNEVLPAAVLQHSIRRHCSLSVEVVTMAAGSTDPVPDGPGILLTPRAQALMDLRPLWRAGVSPMELVVPKQSEGAEGPGLALAGSELSPIVPALASLIGRRAPLRSLQDAAGNRVRAALLPDWNPGWRSDPSSQPLVLYYPPDGTEPWMSRGHPVGHLWVRDLFDAVARGFLKTELVAQEVRLGHVRPSLLYQVEHGLEEPLLLPRRARLLDRDFAPAGAGRAVQPAAHRWVRLSRAIARQVRRRIHRLRTRHSALDSSAAPQPHVVARP